jgi:hypothetical protein
MAVTDEQFQALSVEVRRLAARVRVLEDDRAVDRAEAQVRHRAVVDSLQALRETQIEQGQDIAGLREDVTGLHLSVAGLEGTVTGLQGSVAGLEGTMTGLQGSVTGLEGTMTGLQGSVTGLEGTMTGLQGTVTGLRGDMERGFATIGETLAHVVRLMEDDAGG